MAIARVQAVAGTNGSGTGAYTITITSTGAGNIIIVVIGTYGSNNNPTVADSATQTYAQDLGLNSGGSFRASVYSKANTAGGVTTVTITPSAHSSAVVMEYSGVATSSAFDVGVSAINAQTAVTTWGSNNITTTATDLLLGFVGTILTATPSFASSGSWATVKDSPNSGDGDGFYVQEQLNVAANTYAAAGTCSSTTARSGIVSYKAAAVATVTWLDHTPGNRIMPQDNVDIVSY